MLDITFVDVTYSLKEKIGVHYRRTNSKDKVFISNSILFLNGYLNNNGITSNITSINSSEARLQSDIDSIPPAKVFAFSTLTCVYNYTLDIKRRLKKKFPNSIFIIGNIHVTLNPDESITNGFDYVFIGEGFKSLLLFMHQVRNGDLPKEKKILSIPIKTYDDINYVSPNLVINSEGPDCYALVFRSSGCNNRCAYCVVKDIHPGRIVRSKEKIVNDFRSILQKGKKYRISFSDTNPITCKQDLCDLLEIYDILTQEGYFLKYGLQYCYKTLINLNRKYPEEVNRLLTILDVHFTGLETLHEDNTQFLSNKIELNLVNEYLKLISRYKAKLFIHVIIGFPTDTEESIEKLGAFSKSNPNIIVLPHVLTPFHGSDLYKGFKSKGLILTDDYSLYDTANLVWKHPTLSDKYLKSKCIDLMLKR